MTALVSIDFKFPDMLGHYNRNVKRIALGMLSDIQTNRGLLFDAEGGYNGHEKWKDLASGKNLQKAKNGLQSRQILHKSGALRLSLAPQNPDGNPGPGGYCKIEGDGRVMVAKVGTPLAYARIHNEGGTINHPGTDNGFGKGIKIPAHQINIPKRNFTDWNEADAKNMRKFLKNLVAVLNGE